MIARFGCDVSRKPRSRTVQSAQFRAAQSYHAGEVIRGASKASKQAHRGDSGQSAISPKIIAKSVSATCRVITRPARDTEVGLFDRFGIMPTGSKATISFEHRVVRRLHMNDWSSPARQAAGECASRRHQGPGGDAAALR